MTVQPMLTAKQLEKAGINNPAEQIAYFKSYPIGSASDRAKARREMSKVKAAFIGDCVKNHISSAIAWAEVEVESDSLSRIVKAMIANRMVAIIETA